MRFAVLLILVACGGGFSQEEIDKTKAAILTEFSTHSGVDGVLEVVLAKESSRHLTGFVKVSVSGETITIDCHADYYPDSTDKVIWKCPSASQKLSGRGSDRLLDIDAVRIQVNRWKTDIATWAIASRSDKACSEISFAEVGKFITREELKRSDLRDVWGKPIQIMCSESGVRGVYSFGPNKRDDKGEGDDVASWRAQ